MKKSNPLLQSFSRWFDRNFSDPGAISLFMTLVLGLLLLEYASGLLMPILVSLVLSYLLAAPVRALVRCRFPHGLAATVMLLVLVGAIIGIVLLIPVLWRQLAHLVVQIPDAFTHAQVWLNQFMQHHPKWSAGIHWQTISVYLQQQSVFVGKWIVQQLLSLIPNLLQVILYLVLVPLLVFFMLKDSGSIWGWCSQYLPEDRGLVTQVWSEFNVKLAAYIRGRVIEVIIISLVTTLTFWLFGLQYAMLLGVLTGLSVLVPYVGAVVAAIPVVIICLMQWGWSGMSVGLVVAYLVILLLDGNVLVPLLFSETMSLHPMVILISVIVFGGIWGFWGVFFAIPLAALVHSVLKAWPTHRE